MCIRDSVGGVVLVACALGQPGERVAALVAAGLFTVASPHAALKLCRRRYEGDLIELSTTSAVPVRA